MFFDKQTVLDHISQQVGPDQAARAAQVLPDQVDHEQHGEMLQQFGVDPQSMADQLGGQQVGRRTGGYGEQREGGYGDPSQGSSGQQGGSGQQYGDRDRDDDYQDR